MQLLSITLAIIICISLPAFAQFPTGANRPDISWHQLATAHFTIVYHDGLESAAREAADVAEAVYPVVTGNLREPLPDRTLLYLSDLDDVPNAFAFDDHHMYIWMRGILDDMPLGGIRSSGRAKWFRAVITHEFTHIVIAHATKSWAGTLLPLGSGVPRWFNEGTARFMEPDGWTSDIDEILRVAAVNGGLRYDGLGKLDGYLLYETGHSIVRYMTERFGDSTIARIVHGGRSGLGFYDFDLAVHQATGESMGAIYAGWYRTVTVLYGTVYGAREEADEISKPLTKRFGTITGIRVSPDGRRLAMIASDRGLSEKLYLMGADPAALSDSGAKPVVLSDEPGFDDEFSWSPDGHRLVLSKYRFGAHSSLVHDLFILDVESQSLRRLTSSASQTDPAWSPDGSTIVAVEKRIGRDNLVLIDPADGSRSQLTMFSGDVQLYTPSWSPDGTRIAVSMFGADGTRSIVIVNRNGTGIRTLVADSANNRYPVWSPDGSRIAFTSHAGGIPNIQSVDADGGDRHYITDVAGGIYTVQWLPGSDSIVAISFDSDREILPHLIPASRRVTPTPAPSGLREKYTAWKSVALPLQTPPASAITETPKEDLGDYSSLAHIGPVVPVIPWYSTDLSRDGSDTGARLGLLTTWSDPMGIHSFAGFADYGTRSRQFGGEAEYINNYLPLTLDFKARYTLGFEGVVADRPYYQRTGGGSIEISRTVSSPNSMTTFHRFAIGARHRRLEPWSLNGFEGLPASRVPIAARLTELTAGYSYISPTLYLDGEFLRSEPKLGSTLRFNTLRAHASLLMRLDDEDRVSILTNFQWAGRWGAELPQEFLGLDPYDQFEGGFNLATVGTSYRVRGIRRYIYGDRVMVASMGLQQRLGDLPPALSPKLLLFVEEGSAWYAHGTSVKDVPFAFSYGAELRLPALMPGVWLGAGIAFEMKEKPRRDLYIRLEKGL